MVVTMRRIPSALLQPDSTSVRGPRSNCGTPRMHPASSYRASTTATRQGRMPGPPQAHWRARSRSSVVLPHPRAGQHQRGIRQPIPVRQIRQHGRGRARHRAADAEVERRDVRHALDCAARSDRAPAHADAVPARQRDKPLPQLLLPGIERTFAHARKRFSTVLGARGRAAPGGIDQPLVSGKTQLQRLAGAHADLLQRRGGLDGRQHLHNPLRQIRLQIVLPRSLFHPRTRSFPGPARHRAALSPRRPDLSPVNPTICMQNGVYFTCFAVQNRLK